MTDKELIMQALDEINRLTSNPKKNYVDLRNGIWKGFDREKRSELRKLLFSNGFIRHQTDDTWKFQLTSEGILTKRWHLDRNGRLWFFRTQNFRNFMIATTIATISAIITSVLTVWLDHNRNKDQTLLNKSVEIRQTIYSGHSHIGVRDSVSSNVGK